MRTLVIIVCLLLIPAAAVTQVRPPVWPEDRILAELVGNWSAKGSTHGHAHTWTMHGEWVLDHQFLRFTEKSVENIYGQSSPFEAVYYLLYDYKQHRYIAHLLKSYGAEDSAFLGYGKAVETNWRMYTNCQAKQSHKSLHGSQLRSSGAGNPGVNLQTEYDSQSWM